MDEQTMARLRVRPVRLVQNTTDDTIVLGQANETLAAFTFPPCWGEPDDRSSTGLITTINLHQRTKRT